MKPKVRKLQRRHDEHTFGRRIQRRPRLVLFSRAVLWQDRSDSRCLVRHYSRLAPFRTVIFARWRQDLGGELYCNIDAGKAMKVCYIDSMGRLLKELKMRKVQTIALILAGD